MLVYAGCVVSHALEGAQTAGAQQAEALLRLLWPGHDVESDGEEPWVLAEAVFPPMGTVRANHLHVAFLTGKDHKSPSVPVGGSMFGATLRRDRQTDCLKNQRSSCPEVAGWVSGFGDVPVGDGAPVRVVATAAGCTRKRVVQHLIRH